MGTFVHLVNGFLVMNFSFGKIASSCCNVTAAGTDFLSSSELVPC